MCQLSISLQRFLPATKKQLHRDFPIHENVIVQWVADGHISIIGYGCEDKYLRPCKVNYQKDLQRTSWERNSAVVGKRLDNGFGDYDGNKTEIKEG